MSSQRTSQPPHHISSFESPEGYLTFLAQLLQHIITKAIGNRKHKTTTYKQSFRLSNSTSIIEQMTRNAREVPERQPEYWTAELVPVEPRKKALLIGIQYERDEESGEEDEANALRGPHADVASMRDLLIGASLSCPTLTSVLTAI